MEGPACIYVFSGKRKSGKDFITERLLERIGEDKAKIVRLSGPIKEHRAKLQQVNYDKLLDSSEFKEQHRLAMIKWGEEQRAKDYGYFCRIISQEALAQGKPIWIISDARRKTDYQWFAENYGAVLKKVRVSADEEVRAKRGWVFTHEVDDAPSECDLDDVHDWDWQLTNNGSDGEIDAMLEDLVIWAQKAMNK